MPITPTYPGVYIEEIPSGVRTITGVATSITAFIGRALRGPVSEPIIINNFGEFESRFGGLWLDGPMSYAVRDFYQNGGSQAIIVRLFSDPAKKAAKAAEEVFQAAEKEASRTADPNATPPTTAPTPASVAAVARAKANEFQKEPAKTAANKVAKAAEDESTRAADPNATPPTTAPTANSVKDAAKKAQEAFQAKKDQGGKALLRLPLPDAKAAEEVLKAAEKEASRTADPNATPPTTAPTPASVAAVARAKANEFQKEPAKTAANKVAKAAEDESTRAADPNATPPTTAPTANSVKDAAKKAQEVFQTTELTLESANSGKWSNNLKVIVNYDGITQDVADRYGLQKTDLFNLIVTDGSVKPETVETISNVSVIEGPRRLDRVLQEESLLVRLSGNLPLNRPNETKDNDGNPTPIKVNPEDRVGDSDSLGVEDYTKSEKDKTGLYALEKADLFNLLCIPPDRRDDDTKLDVYKEALTYCVKRRAMLIVDPPLSWGKIKETAAQKAKEGFTDFVNGIGANTLKGRNAAIYFPRVVQADPLRENQLDTFVACGAITGIMASTDVQRGVWKAPAGIDAGISGIRRLQANLTDDENGILNPLGINCLRSFPVYGRVIWGARTLRGADQLADEYKYLPVRRLLLFLQESLYRGTQWVVFEPNDEPLWAQITLNLGTFMNDLFRQGAFQGKSPNEAYFVKCDSETTTQSDINRGIVNIIVGFAPLKPAEFVIIKFQQIAKLPS